MSSNNDTSSDGRISSSSGGSGGGVMMMTRNSCNKGHELQIVKCLHNQWHCGNCLKSHSENEARWVCLECFNFFDLCFDCKPAPVNFDSCALPCAFKSLDARFSKTVRTFKGHKNEVNCVVHLSDNRILSGSDDESVKIWNAETGGCLKTLVPHNNGVFSICKLDDGNIVAGSGGQFKVWNPLDGQCLHDFKRSYSKDDNEYYQHSGPIRSLVSLGSDKFASSGKLDQFIKIWSTEGGKVKCLQTLSGSRGVGEVNLTAVSSTRFISGGHDETIKVWTIDKSEVDILNQCKCSLILDNKFNVDCVALLDCSRNNRNNSEQIVVACGGWSKEINIWSITIQVNNEGKELVEGVRSYTLTATNIDSFFSNAWASSICPLGQMGLAVGFDNGVIVIFDCHTKQCIQTFTEHKKKVWSLCLLPNGDLVSGSKDDTIMVWQNARTYINATRPSGNSITIKNNNAAPASSSNTPAIAVTSSSLPVPSPPPSPPLLQTIDSAASATQLILPSPVGTSTDVIHLPDDDIIDPTVATNAVQANSSVSCFDLTPNFSEFPKWRGINTFYNYLSCECRDDFTDVPCPNKEDFDFDELPLRKDYWFIEPCPAAAAAATTSSEDEQIEKQAFLTDEDKKNPCWVIVKVIGIIVFLPIYLPFLFLQKLLCTSIAWDVLEGIGHFVMYLLSTSWWIFLCLLTICSNLILKPIFVLILYPMIVFVLYPVIGFIGYLAILVSLWIVRSAFESLRLVIVHSIYYLPVVLSFCKISDLFMWIYRNLVHPIFIHVEPCVTSFVSDIFGYDWSADDTVATNTSLARSTEPTCYPSVPVVSVSRSDPSAQLGVFVSAPDYNAVQAQDGPFQQEPLDPQQGPTGGDAV